MSPLRVEFHRPPEQAGSAAEPPPPGPPPPPPPPLPAVASVTWRDGQAHVDAEDGDIRARLHRAFRSTPVVVDDPSLRSPGTHGELLLQPGDLEWFRAVAQFRVPEETGLVARFVPGVRAGGFDPASNYRRFPDQIERLDRRSTS